MYTVVFILVGYMICIMHVWSMALGPKTAGATLIFVVALFEIRRLTTKLGAMGHSVESVLVWFLAP